jgi:nucleotide-binding universal stress UspA family protein
MRILAPFDLSHRSQATIPLLRQLARSAHPDVEVTLLSVAHAALGAPSQQSIRDRVAVRSYREALPVPLPDFSPRVAETQKQASVRVLAMLHQYLLDIAGRLPSGIRVNTEAYISPRPTMEIAECARYRRVDVIVVATRSRATASSYLFGSTTEALAVSGLAPVLIVQPRDEAVAQSIDPELHMTRRARLAGKPA